MDLAITLNVVLIYWMPMSSLLISNKRKVRSFNWLVTNNNFWCSQEKKCKFQMHYLDKRDFLSAIWHMSFFKKGELVNKNTLKRSVLKSQFLNPKIWTRKIDFFTRFTQKQLPIHDGTKNRLNTLSHRLLGGSLEVTTKYYVKIKMMLDCVN